MRGCELKEKQNDQQGKIRIAVETLPHSPLRKIPHF